MSIKPGKAERDQWIVRLYNSGKNAREIAAIVGISYELARYTLVHHKNELTETPRQRYDRKYKGKDNTIRALKAQGYTRREIMALTGCGLETVRRISESAAAIDPTPEQVSIIQELARDPDTTFSDLRKATKLPNRAIKRIMKHYSIYLTHPEDIEAWFPPPDYPQYPDELWLKPNHRARYEEVKRRRQEHTKPHRYGKNYFYGEETDFEIPESLRGESERT